ncbi:ATP synthase subunit delta [Halomicronema hongdechloris C2206]|uniref:ATP synthase subunit delta n=1 Tax=Halomicronema hongdechloris C2206 TaxID=1641165 RepID=A0A1Z3HQ17_9CYAN|nr:ATP synthase F1 subunit delta [Halomicronema hongdechloris]ASC72342.1 ATP synthase subunit delta [Halomicronema hongdechloris C2206]
MSTSNVTAEIVGPYAEALLAIAQDNDLAERFGEDADALLSLLTTSDELTQFLNNPLVSSAAKKGALKELVRETVHPLMLNFLMLLVDRGRILLLTDILRQYQALLRELKQTVLAEVTAAVDLSEAQQAALRQQVIEMTGAHQAELTIEINPDLLGGVIIKVGSQVVDASLRGQLRRIGMQLSSATV